MTLLAVRDPQRKAVASTAAAARIFRPRWRMVLGSGMAASALLVSLVTSGHARADEGKRIGEGNSAAKQVEITENARTHFRAGVNMLQDPDGARYAEAYREFRAAYADSPSWKILGNLGLAAMKLERDGEAIEAFRTYLQEGGSHLDAGERSQVQRDLETLEAGVVWVTIRAEPAGVRLTDTRTPLAGAPVVNRYSMSDGSVRIGLRPGSHRLVAELDGYETATWAFEGEPGSTHEHTFELLSSDSVVPEQPLPRGGDVVDVGTHRPVPGSVYVSLAVAGTLVAGGAVTGVMALGRQREFDRVNSTVASDADEQRARDLRREGNTLNLATDILLGSALVAGGAAAFFYFTRPEVKVEQAAAWSVTPAALDGGGGLWMHGKF